MSEPIKAKKALVVFFDGLTIEGYKMPNGSFRVGLEGVTRVLGYSEGWLTGVINGEAPRTNETLKELGFSNTIVEIKAKSDQGNLFIDQTVTLKDFQRCIVYATQAKKRAAVALSLAFYELSLNDFFRDAFGDPPLSIDEKRELFYQAYAFTISPEDWREMDRQEIANLALNGDEPHLKDGRWNDYIIGDS